MSKRHVTIVAILAVAIGAALILLNQETALGEINDSNAVEQQPTAEVESSEVKQGIETSAFEPPQLTANDILGRVRPLGDSGVGWIGRLLRRDSQGELEPAPARLRLLFWADGEESPLPGAVMNRSYVFVTEPDGSFFVRVPVHLLNDASAQRPTQFVIQIDERGRHHSESVPVGLTRCMSLSFSYIPDPIENLGEFEIETGSNVVSGVARIDGRVLGGVQVIVSPNCSTNLLQETEVITDAFGNFRVEGLEMLQPLGPYPALLVTLDAGSVKDVIRKTPDLSYITNWKEQRRVVNEVPGARQSLAQAMLMPSGGVVFYDLVTTGIQTRAKIPTAKLNYLGEDRRVVALQICDKTVRQRFNNVELIQGERVFILDPDKRGREMLTVELVDSRPGDNYGEYLHFDGRLKEVSSAQMQWRRGANLDVYLGSELSGTVARLYLKSSSERFPYRETQVGSDGVASFRALPPGEFHLLLRHRWHGVAMVTESQPLEAKYRAQ